MYPAIVFQILSNFVLFVHLPSFSFTLNFDPECIDLRMTRWTCRILRITLPGFKRTKKVLKVPKKKVLKWGTEYPGYSLRTITICVCKVYFEIEIQWWKSTKCLQSEKFTFFVVNNNFCWADFFVSSLEKKGSMKGLVNLSKFKVFLLSHCKHRLWLLLWMVGTLDGLSLHYNYVGTKVYSLVNHLQSQHWFQW